MLLSNLFPFLCLHWGNNRAYCKWSIWVKVSTLNQCLHIHIQSLKGYQSDQLTDELEASCSRMSLQNIVGSCRRRWGEGEWMASGSLVDNQASWPARQECNVAMVSNPQLWICSAPDSVPYMSSRGRSLHKAHHDLVITAMAFSPVVPVLFSIIIIQLLVNASFLFCFASVFNTCAELNKIFTQERRCRQSF